MQSLLRQWCVVACILMLCCANFSSAARVAREMSDATGHRDGSPASFRGKLQQLREAAAAELQRTRMLIEQIDSIDDAELSELRVPGRRVLWHDAPCYGGYGSYGAYGTYAPCYPPPPPPAAQEPPPSK